jgi:hypothetical protein
MIPVPAWRLREPVLTPRAIDQVVRWHRAGAQDSVLPEACEPDERAEIFDAHRILGRTHAARLGIAWAAEQAALAQAGGDPVKRYLARRIHGPETNLAGMGWGFFIRANAAHALCLLVDDLRLLQRSNGRSEYEARGVASLPALSVVIAAPHFSWRTTLAVPPGYGVAGAVVRGDHLQHLAMLAWDCDLVAAEFTLASVLAERLPRGA